MISAQEAAMRGRIGGLMKSANHDTREATTPARAAFLRQFLDAQPADLPESERQRRAEAALKAHMARLALASARARRAEAVPS